MTLTRLITNLNRFLLLALCAILVSIWAAAVRGNTRGPANAGDFLNMYYGTRCFLEHKDLYNPQTVRAEVRATGGELPEMSAKEKAVSGAWLMVQVYLPPAYIVMAPFAELPRGAAETIWFTVVPVLMVLAGYFVWDLAADAPVLAGCLICFILLNSLLLLGNGNPAGLILPFCVISAWCFLRERIALLGVLLLAAALVMKPHDTGLVWLFFLLSPGKKRRYALHTVGAAALMSSCAVLWIVPASPHWIDELHGSLVAMSARGGAADPGPTGMLNRSFSPFISLQNVVSIFKDNPHFYNPVSHVIGGGLILAWMVAVLRKRSTREGTLLALAAISILTMLPVYHHALDAKLLLLAIPACAMLWASKHRARWVALGLTWLAIFVTSDYPIAFFSAITRNVPAPTSTLAGKLTLLALQPAPLVLLATGCFYLWAYVLYEPTEAGGRETAGEELLDTAIAECR